MTRSFRVLVLCTILPFLAPTLLYAQVTTGAPPLGSFGGGPDVINVANLNALWTIPVLHKAGRGVQFSYDLSYNSSIWTPTGSTWAANGTWGWASSMNNTGSLSYRMTITTGQCTRSNGSHGRTTQTLDYWTYVDGLGSPHYFPLASGNYSNGCTGQNTQYGFVNQQASDGSGYSLSATSATVNKLTNSAGSQITPGSAVSIVDRNGNEITESTGGVFTDTLGSTALTVTGSGTPTSPILLTYTAPSGSFSDFRIVYTTYSIQTNFGCPNISEFGTNGTTTANLVSEIDLPDGSKYLFTYENTPNKSGFVTGRLASVSLPTGGSITYKYTGGPTVGGVQTGIVCADGSAAGLQRSTPDTGSNYWNYVRTAGSGAAYTTTVTDPQGNVSTIQFQGIYETQRVVNNNSGTNLVTANTCYNGTASPCTGTAVSLPITQRTVITSTPTTGSSTLQTQNIVKYNASGAPTEFDDYSFGSTGVGGLLRKTIITYASLGSITAFPQQVTVQSGTGATVAQTTYNYDQTTPVPAPTGTPQLASISGPRGNLTSVQRCTNTSSCTTSYIQTATTTYDTAGQPQTITDATSNQTTLSYADTYYVDSGSAPSNPPATYNSSAPTDAFVTSVTLPASGSLSYGYYYYSGQLAKSVDQNGNASYSHYQDLLSRLTSAFGPPVPLPTGGNAMPWVLKTYPSETQTDSYTGILDTSASSSCGSCRHDQALLDALGRNIHGYLVSDPEGQTVVDTLYDTIGRVQTVSHPYRSTNDTTYGLETPTYDGLSRVIKVTHPNSTNLQSLYGPAIGTSGLAAQSCSSSTYGLGYPVLSIDESGRKRQIWIDALGRTIEGDEPDSSGSLTSYTCYSYDALGNILKVIHGAQTRTYVYDSLSRVTLTCSPQSAGKCI